MDITTQPRLQLHGVDFVNVNFNTINPYDNKSPIDLKVDPKVFYPEDHPKHFKIVMDILLTSDTFFELKILAVGNFELADELPEKVKKGFVNTNAPAIMFPYVRSFISTLTSNLGGVTGHLMIPAQFFKGELEELPVENTED